MTLPLVLKKLEKKKLCYYRAMHVRRNTMIIRIHRTTEYRSSLEVELSLVVIYE